MTQDEIMAMAKQVGFPIHHPEWQKAAEEFAALIEEKATEEANARANASWTLMCKKMLDIEREEIAKWIEDAPPLVDFAHNGQGGCLMCGFTPKIAAASIRARKETP